MNFVRLGKSGLKITEMTFGSALTIGTQSCDEGFAQEMIDAAWHSGIRSFDVSNNYGFGAAEVLVGKCLKKYPREEFVVATKGSWPIGNTPYHKGLSRKHILWALDESLGRLQFDYVDIYYAHRYDPEVSMEEIVRTFNWLINTGKIRYWATSEWPLTALNDCIQTCNRLNLEKPICEQFLFSYPIQKAITGGVKSFCDENGLGTLGFSPLCQGYLTGKYTNRIPQDSRVNKSALLQYDKTINFYTQNKTQIDFFISACNRFDVDSVAVALQWCLRKEIYPVFGASKIQQIERNTKALEVDIPLELWHILEYKR